MPQPTPRRPGARVLARTCRSAVWTTWAACVVTLAAGCDRPGAGRVIESAGVRAHFAVQGTNLRDGALASGEDLIVEFSQAVDASSCGARSVILLAGRRRRLAGAAVRCSGTAIRIPASLLRSLTPAEPLTLRLDGGPAPCALRSAAGERLREPYSVSFRVGAATVADLTGPTLVASRPEPGTSDAPAGTSIELRFSEPVTTSSAHDAIVVRAGGDAVPVRIRFSPDRRRALIRPQEPLPAGARVVAEVHRSLTDDAGNPLAPGSATCLEFRTRPSPRREIDEDFAYDDFADRPATNCAWGEIEAPGRLVARFGATPLPCLDEVPVTDLGDRDEVRFQILVRSHEARGGLASALRLRFSRTAGGQPLGAVRIEAGPAGDDLLDGSFQANRRRAQLAVVADHGADLAWEPDDTSGVTVEVPFEQPLVVPPGAPLLLDVELSVEPGARLAASADTEVRALVRGSARERLLPSACLMVCGADSVARSLWYDSGTGDPQWRSALVETDEDVPGTSAVVEFQTAPADARGLPDLAAASQWEDDLAATPTWRFVRFRVRFDGASWEGRTPRLDRIVMPFDLPR